MISRITILLFAISLLSIGSMQAQSQKVQIVENASGFQLVVNGQPMIINGINWDYVPIGNGILDKGIWNQGDDVIRAALDAEMALFKNMGVNAIRTYGLEPKWITYIYDNYGIYTMLNTQFGAYGLTINGGWVPQTDYTDEATREVLMKEVRDMAQKYQGTRGLLVYMIGNENNYHLSWTGAETEAIPIDGVDPGIRLAAEGLYKAFNDAALVIKDIDNSVPVAICNGDLLYLDIVKKYCKDIDIYGTNMYRGISFGDAFQRVKDELNKPILFAEFGADAFNALEQREDQYSQAYYNVGNWKEIYANAAGVGLSGNSIGGFTFQSSDGWWKWNQTKDFDVHNTVATWPNGGYARDLPPGGNNMNEEWFGICAKGPTNERGLYQLYPRAAYYALKEVHSFNPLAPGVNLSVVETYFKGINLMEHVLQARGDKAALSGGQNQKLRVSRLTADFSTFNTGGSLIETPDEPDPTSMTFPNQLGFDHMQSFFIGFEAQPAPNMRANVEFNMLGNVAQNPINEIFYENRGRPQTVVTNQGQVVQNDVNRLAVYRAEFEWDTEYFDIDGFYRTGHYHWGYEGDFFGLYPEANYGPNIDIYNGTAPLGMEVEGKKELKGLKVAFGPELWWGANPAILVKYAREFKGVNITGIFHEDIEQRGATESSFAIPMPKTRRATLALETEVGPLGVQLGGIWGGQPLNGRSFQRAQMVDDKMTIYDDEVRPEDNWGGKIKLTYSRGPLNWYGSAAAQGLVANGGADLTQTFTGWRLKDSGSGNQYNVLSGFTVNVGDFQFGPNFLWQRPIVGPMPNDAPAPGRLRNILTDPFVVRANREQVAGELLITYDPTPGTWMYDWNNDNSEDAGFAVSAGFVYRHLPTSQDAAIGILPDGRTFFAFPGAAPAEDLWEVNTRIVSKINSDLGIIANLYGGKAQARGDSERTIYRYGTNIRMIYKNLRVEGTYALNDWGPYDYHRDFNLTFPHQVMLDVSLNLGTPKWLALPSTQVGVSGIYRTLDQFSPRYCPGKTINAAGEEVCIEDGLGFNNGNEWQIMTYVRVNIFN
jgi:hypothetical protein